MQGHPRSKTKEELQKQPCQQTHRVNISINIIIIDKINKKNMVFILINPTTVKKKDSFIYIYFFFTINITRTVLQSHCAS